MNRRKPTRCTATSASHPWINSNTMRALGATSLGVIVLAATSGCAPSRERAEHLARELYGQNLICTYIFKQPEEYARALDASGGITSKLPIYGADILCEHTLATLGVIKFGELVVGLGDPVTPANGSRLVGNELRFDCGDIQLDAVTAISKTQISATYTFTPDVKLLQGIGKDGSCTASWGVQIETDNLSYSEFPDDKRFITEYFTSAEGPSKHTDTFRIQRSSDGEWILALRPLDETL